MVSPLLALTVLLLPLTGFLIISLAGTRLPKTFASSLASATVLGSFVISLVLFTTVLSLEQDERSIVVNMGNWITTAGVAVSFNFLIDPLSMIMLLMVTGVSFVIHIYSVGYMHDDAGFSRFFSYLNLFVFFMLLLVMSSNYLLMFVGWEGVGLCSWLLIGFWYKNDSYSAAANKAFIMNRIGDLALIIGVVLIFIYCGSLEYPLVFSKLPSLDAGVISLIAILLFAGATGKSAQIPLFTWLPDAMAGPTPVSALIHAATMVTAGVYMVVRNSMLFSMSPLAMQIILVIGLLTAIIGALIAVSQNDIKKVLAYSTVSQLGLMFAALGLGAFASGIFHMMTHAFFKALLFLGAGSVIHALSGEQDLRKMGGLFKKLPVTHITFLIAVLAISGIPPFAGFFSKDEILAAAYVYHPAAWALVAAASWLTAFYMFRLLFLAFYGSSRLSAGVHPHESPSSMTAPLIALAALSALGGAINFPAVFGGGAWLEHFLEPVTTLTRSSGETLSHTTEIALMTIMLGATLVAILIAFMIYIKRRHMPLPEGSHLPLLHRLSYHKFYLDELYNGLIVRPLQQLGWLLDRIVERLGIDGVVNRFGTVTDQSSSGLRRLQQGGIGFYIFGMVISIVFFLALSIINWK